MAQAFQDSKLKSGEISEQTWRRCYHTPVAQTVAILDGYPLAPVPANSGTKLIAALEG